MYEECFTSEKFITDLNKEGKLVDINEFVADCDVMIRKIGAALVGFNYRSFMQFDVSPAKVWNGTNLFF